MTGKHIELFLVSGEPGGITTAEIAGWTGRLLAGPRAELAQVLAREEAQRNGAYVLLGPDPDAVEGLRAYIGRTEDFTRRMRDHHGKKDWWERLVLISSREDSFNEGHWGYLEARMVEVAKAAQRCSLDDNRQTPQPRKLSEAQRSDVEAFLAEVRVVLPVLGVNILRSRRQKPEVPAPAASSSPVFHCRRRKKGVDAHAQLVDGEFFLLAGSRVVAEWPLPDPTAARYRAYSSFAEHHDKLVQDGSIEIRDGFGEVVRDVVFSSPSRAGAVVTGTSCNGRTAWVADDDTTFGDWEERRHA
ncbi:GIY-YIG nuclease family protein [uncultured Tessaracoccus sp.]|uniref:GIY-YIG nuclease family protein n=1 Tax=uncultured Tessaracoccus sp. TaxID=905023 RepID=UPI0025DF9D12|nr:GIY-YIG nuclease family protein [uncultured Tessaracoccus sp.]